MYDRVVKGVVVDAGHGGSDPGAVSGGLQEKDLNLKAAQYMYKRLRELGVPATIVRDSDETLERDERIRRIMQAYGTDPNVIVISNHINAGGGEGAEVVYALRNNSTLAQNILQNIGEQGQIMRKYYQRRLPEDSSKDYYFIQRLTDPNQSLLLEYGFIDNVKDREKLQNNLLDYVEGAVKAIVEYSGYDYSPPTENDTENYVVQRGDNLSQIAKRFNTTVDELKKLNNLTSNLIIVGQTLKIPIQIQEQPQEEQFYTIKQGDTLFSIAQKYDVTVDELKEFNNLTSNTLSIGQILRIPGTFEETTSYTVVKGDSLYGIAKKFGITVEDLIQANNLNNTVLQIGDELIIPNNSTTQTYTVQKGESLFSIAKKFNTTVDKLKQLNNLTSNLLQIGQTLIIEK